MQTDDYEKLGVFYLGSRYDLAAGVRLPEPILYDAKDLTTHAVIVGMTGSGKTGLAVSLLEEAILDGIPVIAIDPKGDLGNLMLTFPELRPADFEPWIDPAEAARQGLSRHDAARARAKLWREGLADWGQTPERIARFAAAAERTLYTPGSGAGEPLSILSFFAAPTGGRAEDDETLRERVQSSVSGLLGLLGIDADPIRSREHVLLSTLVERSFHESRSADFATLIRQVQKPPFDRVGVFDLESFYPSDERLRLAMAINNMLASPGFASWLEGAPLDAGSLLYTADGRPRLSIVSLAHLPDDQRMFVVTLLLEEIVSWMRTQAGSGSLRAILYMDEVFGFFPPTANPPAKRPMLTLLKQARAYGLGVVLATQNPVDLDYKGLSNAGTWFLGRLQTERDKQRVIEGLEGAATAARGDFDRAAIERTLAGVGSRVFLMNNVHDDAPVLMHTRWALSYLAGPMTREQIRTLRAASDVAETDGASLSGARTASDMRADAPTARADEQERSSQERLPLPAGVMERFVAVARAPGAADRLLYRPALLAVAQLHWVAAAAGVDVWQRRVLLAPLQEDPSDRVWEEAEVLPAQPDLESEPHPAARFAALPVVAGRASLWPRLRKQLLTHLYRGHALELMRCRTPKAIARPGESEGEFRGRAHDLLREARDAEIEKLRRRHAPKLRTLRDRIARAEERVDRETEQYEDSRRQSAISVGASLIGALFGRKLGSVGNVRRAGSAARGISRTSRQKGDIARAEERLEALRAELEELEAALADDLGELETIDAAADLELESLRVAPRKSDLEIEWLGLVWLPWRIDADGIAERAFVSAGREPGAIPELR